MITTINLLGDAWLEYFSYAVAQNTVFLIILFAVLYLIRHADARLNYAIGTLGLLKLLIPPFLPLTFRIVPAATATSAMSVEFSILPGGRIAPHLSLVGIIFLLWSATLILSVAAYLLSTVQLKWRIRNASRISSLIMDDYYFDLYQTAGISVPMSIGIRSKRIYVPNTWTLLNAVQQNALLRHEIAHIKRWDGLFGALQMLAQALYFFHPLVWLLNERINEYREMACDDQAVEQSNVTPLAYSRYLVHVAENMLPVWSGSSASALIKQRNKLYHRVNYLVKENANMKTLSKKKRRLIFAGALVLMTLLSWYSSSATPNAAAPVAASEGALTSADVEADQAAAVDAPPQLIGGLAALQKNLVYPEKAKKAGIQGKVMLNVSIDETGQVRHLKILSDAGVDKSLAEAAVAAVKATKWQPALLKGKPVAATVTIPVEFKLSDKKKTGALEKESPAPPPPPSAPEALSPAPDVFDAHAAALADQKAASADQAAALADQQAASADKAAAAADMAVALADQAAKFADQQAASADRAVAAADKATALTDQASAAAEYKDQQAVSVAYDQPPSPVGGFAALVSGVVYPESAQKAGIQGKVLVNALIDEKGNVAETKILKSTGAAGCDEAAIAAIRAVKWNPARRGEKAVAAWVTIPIEFKLK
jgi:TonB family protein